MCVCESVRTLLAVVDSSRDILTTCFRAQGSCSLVLSQSSSPVSHGAHPAGRFPPVGDGHHLGALSRGRQLRAYMRRAGRLQ